jgi:hypothetical protein
MITIKILLMLSLVTIFYQDVKERQVYWFLFPLIAICSALLFFTNTLSELFLTAVILNTIFIVLLLMIVFMYSKFKLKKNHTIGLGDVLFFVVAAFAFSTISFIVVFISSLIFSLVLHTLLNQDKKSITVPLAGYMSLFFGLTYLAYWAGFIQSVYQL